MPIVAATDSLFVFSLGQEAHMSTTVTRRQFLERATVATTAAALARYVTTSAASGMYISLNGALTRGVGGVDKAKLAAKVGFGGVDWDLGPFKMLGLDASKALFADLKIKPTIVNLPLTGPFAGDDDAFKQKLPQLAEDAAFVAGVGCQKMMLVLSAAGPSPKAEYRKLVRDRLAAISDVLAKSNLRLGLEFLGPLYMRSGGPSPCPARAGGPARGGAAAAVPPAAAGAIPTTPPQAAAPAGPPRGGGVPREPFIWTLTETVALAKDSGPNIGAVLDAWHWHHSGCTVEDILAAGKSRIVQVHVSDARQMAPEEVCDSDRLMPGEGVINLVGFFQALQKIGYEDSISPEPLGRIPMDMTPEDAARLGLDTTSAVMRKAGVL
jgi:sugar phosphate isomerase/epimerase